MVAKYQTIADESEKAKKKMKKECDSKEAASKRGGARRWPIWTVQLICELLVNGTPPTAIPANIQTMYMALYGESPAELPSVSYVRGCRAIVEIIGKTIAAIKLAGGDEWAQLWFDSADVLLPAKFMINGRTVRHETAARRVEYWHFLLDSHEVVWSNGVLTESLHPGDVALTGMAGATRAELLEIFPELAGHDASLQQTCLPSLRRFEADLLLRSGDLQLSDGEG